MRDAQDGGTGRGRAGPGRRAGEAAGRRLRRRSPPTAQAQASPQHGQAEQSRGRAQHHLAGAGRQGAGPAVPELWGAREGTREGRGSGLRDVRGRDRRPPGCVPPTLTRSSCSLVRASGRRGPFPTGAAPFSLAPRLASKILDSRSTHLRACPARPGQRGRRGRGRRPVAHGARGAGHGAGERVCLAAAPLPRRARPEQMKGN